MDKERAWLERHSRARRGREAAGQSRARTNLAFAILMRRLIYVISAVTALIILVSVMLNWGKSGIVGQLLVSVLALLGFNGFAWLFERLIRYFPG